MNTKLVCAWTLLFVFGPVPEPQAETLTVRLDGSGEFASIWDALETAAPGDTLLLGPGRYAEGRPFTVPAYTETTYVGINVDDLTIIGESTSSVLIGPESPRIESNSPKGIVLHPSLDSLRLENLTVENVEAGITITEDLTAANLQIRNNRTGLAAFGNQGTESINLQACSFRENREGILTFSYEGPIEILGCDFHDNTSAVVLATSSSNENRVANSIFVSNDVGININQSSNCLVDNSTFSETLRVNIDVSTSGSVALNGNTFGPADFVFCIQNGSLSGGQNVLSAGAIRTMVEFPRLHGHFGGQFYRCLVSLWTDVAKMLVTAT